MPPQQLNTVLQAEWGKDWRQRFCRADAMPIAAASIGQVRRAVLPDGRVLAMDFAPQAVRDQVMTALIELVLRELFEFKVMQTDPNFANHR